MTRNKELAYYFDQKTQEAASTSSRGNKEQKLCIDLLVEGVKMAAWPEAGPIHEACIVFVPIANFGSS